MCASEFYQKIYGTGLNRGSGQHEYDCHLYYVGHTCNYATATSGVARGGTRGGSRGKDARMWAVVAGKKRNNLGFFEKKLYFSRGPYNKSLQYLSTTVAVWCV